MHQKMHTKLPTMATFTYPFAFLMHFPQIIGVLFFFWSDCNHSQSSSLDLELIKKNTIQKLIKITYKKQVKK